MSDYIAPYILKSEYRCGCSRCLGLPPDVKTDPIYPLFFKIFADIRRAWGKPISWNSGYRCVDHNAAVGGKPLSVHLFGLAADLQCADAAEVAALEGVIQKVTPGLRRGTYTKESTFIHIDVGHLIQPRALDEWSAGAMWKG